MTEGARADLGAALYPGHHGSIGDRLRERVVVERHTLPIGGVGLEVGDRTPARCTRLHSSLCGPPSVTCASRAVPIARTGVVRARRDEHVGEMPALGPAAVPFAVQAAAARDHQRQAGGQVLPRGLEEDVEQPVAEVGRGAMHERGVDARVVERRVTQRRLVERVDQRYLEHPVHDSHDLGGKRGVEVGVAGQAISFPACVWSAVRPRSAKSGLAIAEQRGIPLAGLIEHRKRSNLGTTPAPVVEAPDHALPGEDRALVERRLRRHSVDM